MASLIEELLATLEEQKENYADLLVLSEEKINVIAKNDIEMLTKITKAESVIVGSNQKLDKKREECVKNIGIVLNHNPDELTLTKIANLINNLDEKSAILKIKDELEKILVSLKSKNEINNQLIESSLDYVDFSVNLMRQAAKGEVTLSEIGEIKQDNKNLYDTKG